MELRQYWDILWRRGWVVLGLALLTLVASVLVRPTRTLQYQASTRLAVGMTPEAGEGRFYAYDNYYTWLTAEYLADDLAEVVKSQSFAQAVSSRIGSPVPPAAITGATSPKKLHRILTITVTMADADLATQVAQAVASVLQEEGGRFFAQLGSSKAAIAVLEVNPAVPVSGGFKEKLDLPLRVLLGLAAGVGLAFLLDYLDESVRTSADLQSLGFRVLAEIPSRPSRWQRLLIGKSRRG